FSRGFGFLRFPSLARSKDFVESNYPAIFLRSKKGSDNENAAVEVRIAFSRERDDRSRGEKDGQWTCKVCNYLNFSGRTKCHQCAFDQIGWLTWASSKGISMTRTDHEVLQKANWDAFKNAGDNDVSNEIPSQFLLFRSLESSVDEEKLAKGASKLYKPSRISPQPTTSFQRNANAKVASTTGDTNLGAKEGSLRRVLLVRDRGSNDSWRYGFAEFATIDDAQAALFRFKSAGRFTIASKPVMVDYIHSGVFQPVSHLTQEVEKFMFSPLGNATTKLMYWDKRAYVNELTVSTGLPKSSASSIEPQAKSAIDKAAAAVKDEGLLNPRKENETKPKRRKVKATSTGKAKTAIPLQLQQWNDKNAELRGTEINKPSEQNEDLNAKQSIADPPIESKSEKRTFADPEKMNCNLCNRHFHTIAALTTHERDSQLHQDNLKDEDRVSQAEAKMADAGISTVPLAQGDKSEYRNRAEERRKAHGLSNKAFLPMKKQPSLPEPNESDKASVPPSTSIGLSLLGKMGWSEGEGLGARGTGRTEAIATDMYAAGVGLGAQGGKIGDAVSEAGRKTKAGHDDWTERAKEVTKERYEMTEQR
ncbi:MAG: hypothetical protein Q9167_007937, partial [Letrouitia subvulpina]